MADISPITVARFWSKVEVRPSNDECWLWRGATSAKGYGNFKMAGHGRTTFLAHRVSYRIVNGEWPEGHELRHRCDCPGCVNPNHLIPGTHADNMRDMVSRGRHVPRKNQAGEGNPSAKLTKANVERIRELIELRHTNTAIAKMFGVHHATISQIRRGRSWAA
ncbi:MAG: hypothetical protein E5X05_01395 [Mesorhizobium sp.]|nr:MAG: hypothetical protein E5X05_01395 [Mesorhizobium sp.]